MNDLDRSNRTSNLVKLLLILILLGVVGFILFNASNRIDLETLPDAAMLFRSI